ncbi:MAG TPA: hypothetical protein ENF73_04910, partial [Proteobacteria bacterium]|nr:hypothetical protein [Pseudomonadota bacterium]
PASIGFLISEQLSNEEILAVCELAKKIGVKHIGSLADFGPSQVLSDAYRPYITATFDDIAAADVLIITGELEYEMPSVALRVIEADHNDAHIVRVSYRRGKLASFARENYPVPPGDETAVLWAIARALADASSSQPDTVALESLNELKSHALSEWCQPLGIDEARIAGIARRILDSERLVVVLGRNLQYGPDAQSAIGAASLILALSGKAGADGSGVLLSIDRANLRGILDLKDGFDGFWDALRSGAIKGVLAFGADPILEFPGGYRFAAEFERLDLLASTALFEGPLTAKAHLVLPARATCEKSGSVLAADGYMVKFSAAIPSPERALGALELTNELAMRMLGEPVFESPDAASAAVERAITSIELKPAKLEPTKPKLPRASSAKGTVLVVGPELFHAGRLTPYATGPTTLVPSAYVAVSEALAQRLGIAPAQKITLTANRASVSAQVKIDPDITGEVVFAPESFAEPPLYKLLTDSFVSDVKLSQG